MGGLLAELLPTAILGALSPLPILIVLSLLMSSGGLSKALGFTAGLVLVFVVIGAITLITASGSTSSSNDEAPIAGTILAVLGVLFIIIAIKQWVGAPDPDAAPPKFMARLESLSVVKATVLGLVIAVINIKQLGIFVGGVVQIVQADVSTGQRWVALLVLVLLIQAGVLGAILMYVIARDWAIRELQRLYGWLIANSRVIGIVLGFVVGALFTVRGFSLIS